MCSFELPFVAKAITSRIHRGFAMEAFLVLVVLIFEKKTKVLLCSKIKKENKVKKMMKFFVLRKKIMKTRKVERNGEQNCFWKSRKEN